MCAIAVSQPGGVLPFRPLSLCKPRPSFETSHARHAASRPRSRARRHARLLRRGAGAARRRVARGNDRRRVAHGRAPRCRAGRGGADRRHPRRVRDAARPVDLGRRAPVLPAQDPDRTARPHSHAAHGKRAVGFHQAQGVGIRPVRRGAFLHVDLGRRRHGGGRAAEGRGAQRRFRHRRRSDHGGHGLRGHEQCRAHGRQDARDPQRQRHVDRPAHGLHVGLSRALGFRSDLPHGARGGQATRRQTAEIVEGTGAQDGGIRARLDDRRHDVRGAGLLLCRPDRRAQPEAPAAGASQYPRFRDPRPGAASRRDAEGQGLRTGRGVGVEAARGVEVRRHHGRAGEVDAQRAVLHQGLRPVARAGSRGRRAHRRHHGGHAGRHGDRHLRRGIPRPYLRRGDRGAARRDVRGGHGDGGHEALLRHLLDLPAARLRPGGARRRHPGAAGALSHRPGRFRGGRRVDPCGLVRRGVSGLPARLHHHGGGRRG